MMYKNSIRLIFSNFSNMWKILLYKLVVLICVLGLTTVISMPIINVLISEGIVPKLQSVVNNSMFNANIAGLINNILAIIKEVYLLVLNANLLPLLIVSVCFFVIVYTFLSNYCELAVSDNINAYMSSNTKLGFINGFMAQFRKSFVLQCVKMIIYYPLILIVTALSFIIFYFLNRNALLSLVAPLLSGFTFVVLYCLIFTVFSGWLPAIVVHDCGVFEGMKKGFKAVSRRFWRVFSNSIFLVLTIIIINLFMISFTASVGILVTLPLSALFGLIFCMVVYYSSQGMRFYVDSDNIVSPKRLEEQDSIKKVKYII